MPNERRRSPRKPLPFEVLILNADTHQRLGVVVNFNVTGLMMHSSECFCAGQTLTIQLSAIGPNSHSLPSLLAIEILWVDADASSNFWYGAHFVNLTPVQIIAIASFAYSASCLPE